MSAGWSGRKGYHMLVLMMTQRQCACTNDICPGYEDEVSLWLEEAPSVREAVASHIDRGSRVISAYPMSQALHLLASASNTPGGRGGCGNALRTYFPSRECDAPAGFGGNHHNSNGRTYDFYLDPRADSNPQNNPVFDSTPTKPFTPALKDGDKVVFSIPEEFDQEFYRKGCGPGGVYYVRQATNEKATIADSMDPETTTVIFTTYNLFVNAICVNHREADEVVHAIDCPLCQDDA